MEQATFYVWVVHTDETGRDELVAIPSEHGPLPAVFMSPQLAEDLRPVILDIVSHSSSQVNPPVKLLRFSQCEVVEVHHFEKCPNCDHKAHREEHATKH